MTATLEFHPFEVSRANEFGGALAEIVFFSPGLQQDFPHVPERYPDRATGADSVRQVCQAMAEHHGNFGVYAVMLNGRVIGCATFQQRVLWGANAPLAEGPLLALWLDPRRQGAEAGLLPRILWLGAQELAAYAREVPASDLGGTPYTFVRPDHAVVLNALRDPNNGFGGFDTHGTPRVYSDVDDVHLPRILCKAKFTVGQLG